MSEFPQATVYTMAVDQPLYQEPSARRTDPWTSWAAARSVSHLRERQQVILFVLAHHQPLSLSQLVTEYQKSLQYPSQSPSGIRTRCKELEDQGLVEAVGTRTNENGRSERLLAPVVSERLF